MYRAIRTAAAGAALAMMLSVGGTPDADADDDAGASTGGTLRLLNADGFGNPDNIGFDRLAEAGGYLFVGTANTAEGMVVYRSADGEHFEAISGPGIDGDPENNHVVGFGWFEGMLYVAGWDGRQLLDGQPPIGFSLFRADATAEDVDDIEWETITTDGFGHASDQALGGFAVFDGHLYAGTFNHHATLSPPSRGTEGAVVYRTDTGDPGDWTQVSPRGFDDPGCATDAHHSFVHDGWLYYTTEKFACVGTSATELWRTRGGEVPLRWEAVNQEGFGRPYNNNSLATAVVDDHLFVATWGYGLGTEVWRADLAATDAVPFDNWEQVNITGFGDPRNMWTNGMVELNGTLYVAGMDPFTNGRGYLYRTTDPLAPAKETALSWQEITADQWPPPNGPNSGPYDMEVFDGKVFIAHHSGDRPGQLWVYEPSR